MTSAGGRNPGYSGRAVREEPRYDPAVIRSATRTVSSPRVAPPDNPLDPQDTSSRFSTGSIYLTKISGDKILPTIHARGVSTSFKVSYGASTKYCRQRSTTWCYHHSIVRTSVNRTLGSSRRCHRFTFPARNFIRARNFIQVKDRYLRKTKTSTGTGNISIVNSTSNRLLFLP